MRADIIRKEFISLMNQSGEENNFHCYNRIMGGIIQELSGSIHCLIYIKIRSEKPYTWGVTVNRVNWIKQWNIKWFLVLLYGSPNTGYFFTADDVERSLSFWPLGRDGDFKVKTGTYLRYGKAFYSFSEFIDLLIKYCSG